MLSSTNQTHSLTTVKRLQIFAAVPAVLLAVAAGCLPNINPSPNKHEARLDLSELMANPSVAESNGSLTASLYQMASYTPTPVTRAPERRGITAPPQAPPPVNPRNYPPLAR